MTGAAELREHRRERSFVALAMVATAVAAGYALGRPSLWQDEAFTVLAMRDLSRISVGPWFHELAMWLYYLLLAPLALLGEQEWLIRLPSVAAATAAIPVFYVVARRLAGVPAARVATVLLCCHPFYLEYAREARSYSLGLLLTTTGTWLFLVARERSETWPWALYAACAVAAYHAHFFCGFVFLAHAAALPFGSWEVARRWAAWGAGAGFVAVAPSVAVLALPTGYGAIQSTPQGQWFAPFRYLYCAAGRPGPSAVVLLPFLIGLAGALRAVCTAHDDGRTERALCIAWAVVPIAGGFLAAVLGCPLLAPRYCIFSLPGLVLVTSLGLVHLQRRHPRLGGLVALVLAGSFLWQVPELYRPTGRTDWRAAAQYLREAARPGDVALCYAYHVRVPLEYYLRRPSPAGAPTVLELASGPYRMGGSCRLPPPRFEAVEEAARRGARVFLVESHTGTSSSDRAAAAARLRARMTELLGVPSRSPFRGIQVYAFPPG